MAPRRQPLASAGRPKRPSLHRGRLSAESYANASHEPPYYSSADAYRELLTRQNNNSSPPPPEVIPTGNGDPESQPWAPHDFILRSPPPVYPSTSAPMNRPSLPPANRYSSKSDGSSARSAGLSLSSVDLEMKPLPSINDDDSDSDRRSTAPSYRVGQYGIFALSYDSKSSKGAYCLTPNADDDSNSSRPRNRYSIRSTSNADDSNLSLTGPLNQYSIRPTPTAPHTAADDGVHPFFPDSFEKPLYANFILHVILCFIAFPVIFFIPNSHSFQGLSIFWIRIVCGLCASAAGIMLARSFMVMATRALEATVWATIIHESALGANSGITLREFARYNYDPLSVISALLLLYRRMRKYRGSKRKNRRYDTFPWNLSILFYLLVMGLAVLLPFIFGRLIIISTSTARQTERFKRTVVIGDLSEEDVARAAAQSQAFTDFVRTWTLSPFTLTSQLPRPVRLSIPSFNASSVYSRYAYPPSLLAAKRSKIPSNSSSNSDPDYVYFAEAFTAQLTPRGKGFGTFESLENQTSTSPDGDNGSWPPLPTVEGDKKTAGAVVRWPRWGIRVVCDFLPNMDQNLMPQSRLGMTYALIPRSTIAELMDRLGLNMPDTVPTSFNISTLMEGNDTWPGATGDGIAYGGKWWNNGVAQSFLSKPISTGADGRGWIQMESVLVRLNNTYTPNGSFGTWGPVATDGNKSRIGYDAAVCVEAVEPWILDAYHSTAGSPSTLAIVGRQSRATLLPMSDNGKEHGMPDDGVMKGVTTSLNSTGKWSAFAIAHENSRNLIVKDNGRDFMYVPSPMVVSFTNGTGPNGYSRLSPAHLAAVLGQADAVGLLPFLVGSQRILAVTYKDRTLAFAHANAKFLIPFLIIIILVGFLATFFVPRLPFGLPRRDFGMFSWLALVDLDELKRVLEENREEGRGLVDVDGKERRARMCLEEMAGRFGDVKLRYGAR